MYIRHVMDGPWKPKTYAREDNTNIWIPKIPQLASSNSFCLLSLSVSVSVSFHNQTTKQNSIPLNFPLPPNRTSLIAAGKIQFPPGVKKIAHRLLYLGGSLRRWYHPKTLIGYPNWSMQTMEVSPSKVLASPGLFTSNLLAFPGSLFSPSDSLRVRICF